MLEVRQFRVQRKEGMMQPYPTPGSELAGYRIEALLGRGGMAIVYLAEHLRLGRKVALKLLAPELAGDEQFQQRFVRESQLAAAIDHPNIIPIYDAGEANGLLYIAMRYVAGTDLRARLKQAGRLDPDRIVVILGQVAGALDAAHAHGLVHRDVKPANILLGPGPGAGPDDPEHVYLSDFGLTKRSASASGLTATGLFVGTLDYAAPEQIEGKPVDGRTDGYALGCVLFECLTGLPPYRYDEDRAVMWAHLVGEIPQVTAHRPELPAGVDEVVARALAKLPDDRYPTCRAMISELGTVLAAGLGGAAQQPTAMPNKPLAEVPTPAVATESEAAETPHDDTAAMSAQAGKPPDPSRTGAPKAPERSKQVSRSSTASIPLAGPAGPGRARLPSDQSKLPDQQRRRLSTRAGILAGVGVGVVVILVLIVSIVTNSNTTSHPPSAGATITTSLSTEKVIFRDDFSNRAGGWDDAGSKRVGGHYSNHAYRLDADPAVGDLAVGSPRTATRVYPAAPLNLRIAVDVRPVAGSDQDVGYHIFCRADEQHGAYAFIIWSGYVAIAKYDSSGYHELKTADTPAVHANATNRMQGECTTVEGQQAVRLVFSVNGQVVADVTDTQNPLQAGTVGLGVKAGTNAHKAGKAVEAEFDNFVVTQI